MFRIMRKNFKTLCAIEAGSNFEALQHLATAEMIFKALNRLLWRDVLCHGISTLV